MMDLTPHNPYPEILARERANTDPCGATTGWRSCPDTGEACVCKRAATHAGLHECHYCRWRGATHKTAWSKPHPADR